MGDGRKYVVKFCHSVGPPVYLLDLDGTRPRSTEHQRDALRFTSKIVAGIFAAAVSVSPSCFVPRVVRLVPPKRAKKGR